MEAPQRAVGRGNLFGGLADRDRVMARAVAANLTGGQGPKGVAGCRFDIEDHEFVEEEHDERCDYPPELREPDDEPW